MMTRGFLEILEMADGRELKHFDDFTKITIRRTKLSSATVSKRLDELISAGVIEEVVTRSKTGRRIIAYRATEKGRKVIKVANELQEAVAAQRQR
jgi:DNA-binding HxlR family transcriptional regulator